MLAAVLALATGGLALPLAASAETCTFTSDGDYASAASFSGTHDCAEGVSPDDVVACSGTPPDLTTVRITGPIEFTTGSFRAEAGCEVVFDVPQQDRALRMAAGAGGGDPAALRFASGSTLIVRGGWIPAGTSGGGAPLADAPATPFRGADLVELAPGGDPTRVRLWYRSGADGAANEAALRFLSAIAFRAGQGRVLVELHDPDPDERVGGDSLSRYTVAGASCDGSRLPACDGVAADANGDGVAELGFVDLSMRQFEDDHVGLRAAFQDLVRTAVVEDAPAGRRCVRVQADALQPSTPGAIDERNLENTHAGWWISLESDGQIAATAPTSLALAYTLDAGSPRNDTGADVLCVADARGLPAALVASDPERDELVIHRGILPGDPIRAYVPVHFTRSPLAPTGSVSFAVAGAAQIRGAHWSRLAGVNLGDPFVAEPPDPVDGGIAVVEESSFFDCEATGAACMQILFPPGVGGEAVVRGFTGAGGGTCADDAAPYCEPLGDGDVHYWILRNATVSTLERVSVRWARDDVLFSATSPDPLDLDTRLTVREFVGQDVVSTSFGPDTGNLIDCTVDDADGYVCDLDVQRAVCANCTTDDGAPALALVTDDTDATGRVDDLGVLGALGGAVDAAGVFRDRSMPLFTRYVNLGSRAAPNTFAGTGGALLPRRVDGFAVQDFGDGGSTQVSKYALLPIGGEASSIRNGYVRDVRVDPDAILPPGSGLVQDVALVNVNGRGLFAPVDFGNASGLVLRDISFVETQDLRTGRWGSGPEGLFLGAPVPSADLDDALVVASNGVTAAFQLGGLLFRGWSADTAGVDFALDYLVDPAVPQHVGNACFDAIAGADLSPDDEIGLTGDGFAAVRGETPDYFDPDAGDFYAARFRAAHGCGVSRPVGVCEPTWFTRRYALDWRQLCMGGAADTDGDCDPDVAEIAGGSDPLVPDGPVACPAPAAGPSVVAAALALATLARRRARP